jgi:GTP-binding protein
LFEREAMNFLDEAKVYVRSGDGGRGCLSFRREKFIPFGGPDGGNGGRGGDVVAVAVPGLNTLIDFRYRQHFKAAKGGYGKGANRTGADAPDLVLEVPVGTLLIAEDKETVIADLAEPGARFVLAEGGDGGFGNAHYKSSTNRAPRRADPGREGSERWVWLRLKLLADAGLIGLPNAGKSTFLSRVSAAKPKIGDYPFTTLNPQLGMVKIDETDFVIADLPGLIEGAHEGAGLGDRFLGHAERCGAILHLIDGTQSEIVKAYKTIRGELEAYGHGLAQKPEILVLNKIDAIPKAQIVKKKAALEKASGEKVHLISGVSGEGVNDVLRLMVKEIAKRRARDKKRPAVRVWTP